MKAISHIRISLAAAMVVLLGGCSVSPTVDAVSWTVDGVSFLLTGKSMTDHAMSAAAGKDCAMTRVVKGDTACLPNDEDVAGDRLVFEFDAVAWGASPAAATGAGDPMSVHAAIADIAAPLGDSVSVDRRHDAVAAVVDDTIPLNAFVPQVGGGTEKDAVFSARIKDKSSRLLVSPDRETRLWLPVKADAE